ncbi:hypothetical protein EV197_2763 [Aquimarina brevivitae]|uniref:Uncharacterized protein n=1 Tax=Aquimarina brevivitae TaxID=323412 RepID=A0A4Q7NZ50_9FLAO|nr:hypothetical protein EV197_2763 [Aquimarina brevivitae]
MKLGLNLNDNAKKIIKIQPLFRFFFTFFVHIFVQQKAREFSTQFHFQPN